MVGLIMSWFKNSSNELDWNRRDRNIEDIKKELFFTLEKGNFSMDKRVSTLEERTSYMNERINIMADEVAEIREDIKEVKSGQFEIKDILSKHIVFEAKNINKLLVSIIFVGLCTFYPEIADIIVKLF